MGRCGGLVGMSGGAEAWACRGRVSHVSGEREGRLIQTGGEGRLAARWRALAPVLPGVRLE